MKGKSSVFSAYAKSKAKTSAEARRLSIAELEKLIANLNASLAAEKAKVPPRYRLEIDGKEYLWSGRGRTPRVFREYFDAGNSRESCEIAA